MDVDLAQFASKSDPDLLSIMARREQYQPAVVEAAKKELAKRGYAANNDADIKGIILEDLLETYQNKDFSFTREQVLEAGKLLEKEPSAAEQIHNINRLLPEDEKAESIALLPKVWIGLVLALILSLYLTSIYIINLSRGLNSSGSANDFIGYLVRVCLVIYWFWCIHRLHRILSRITHLRYPISPWEAVGKHYIPFYNLYWIYRWPVEFGHFIKGTNRVPIIPERRIGLFCLGAVLLSFFHGALTITALFVVTHYLSRKLKQYLATNDELPRENLLEEMG